MQTVGMVRSRRLLHRRAIPRRRQARASPTGRPQKRKARDYAGGVVVEDVAGAAANGHPSGDWTCRSSHAITSPSSCVSFAVAGRPRPQSTNATMRARIHPVDGSSPGGSGHLGCFCASLWWCQSASFRGSGKTRVPGRKRSVLKSCDFGIITMRGLGATVQPVLFWV